MHINQWVSNTYNTLYISQRAIVKQSLELV